MLIQVCFRSEPSPASRLGVDMNGNFSYLSIPSKVDCATRTHNRFSNDHVTSHTHCRCATPPCRRQHFHLGICTPHLLYTLRPQFKSSIFFSFFLFSFLSYVFFMRFSPRFSLTTIKGFFTWFLRSLFHYLLCLLLVCLYHYAFSFMSSSSRLSLSFSLCIVFSP